MKYHYIDMMLYFVVFFLALFLYKSHYDDGFYKRYYYVGMKLFYLISIFGYQFSTTGLRRIVILAISGFLLIDVIWEVGYIENYRWAAWLYWLDMLFGILIIGLLFIFLIHEGRKQHKKWQKLK